QKVAGSRPAGSTRSTPIEEAREAVLYRESPAQTRAGGRTGAKLLCRRSGGRPRGTTPRSFGVRLAEDTARCPAPEAGSSHNSLGVARIKGPVDVWLPESRVARHSARLAYDSGHPDEKGADRGCRI